MIHCNIIPLLCAYGSALEVVLHDYALYKSTFTLLYFIVFVRTSLAYRHMPAPITHLCFKMLSFYYVLRLAFSKHRV